MAEEVKSHGIYQFCEVCICQCIEMSEYYDESLFCALRIKESFKFLMSD